MISQVLLVDVDPSILDVYGTFLELSGYKVIKANNATQGIELYKKHKPCIVFSDVKMPGIDGYEFFSTIHKLDPQAKIIFVTGFEDEKNHLLQ